MSRDSYLFIYLLILFSFFLFYCITHARKRQKAAPVLPSCLVLTGNSAHFTYSLYSSIYTILLYSLYIHRTLYLIYLFIYLFLFLLCGGFILTGHSLFYSPRRLPWHPHIFSAFYLLPLFHFALRRYYYSPCCAAESSSHHPARYTYIYLLVARYAATVFPSTTILLISTT